MSEKKEETEKDLERNTNKNDGYNLTNIIILIVASGIIGYFSPGGILKSYLTLFVLYIFTSGTQTIMRFINPIIKIAGHLTDNKIKADLTSILLVLGFYIQIFIVNFLIHRYTDFQILDNFMILFWMILYVITWLITKNKQKEDDSESEFLDIVHSIENAGFPKIQIVGALVITLASLKFLGTFPFLIRFPEQILTSLENTFFGIFIPSLKTMPRYHMAI